MKDLRGQITQVCCMFKQLSLLTCEGVLAFFAIPNEYEYTFSFGEMRAFIIVLSTEESSL